MSLRNTIRDLFVAPPSKVEPSALSLEEIRKQIFVTERNLAMRNRQAEDEEIKAQAALEKTFQSGLSVAQRQKLLNEHHSRLRNAKRLMDLQTSLAASSTPLRTRKRSSNSRKRFPRAMSPARAA